MYLPSSHVRFPDGVTVKYGPPALLARYFLKMDQYYRDRGVRLTIRYDYDELVRLNRAESAAGRWFPMPAAYDPELNDLSPDNCFWVSGVNDAGETVLAQAARVYRWGESSFAEHAADLVYGDRGVKGPCVVDCPAAHEVTGTVNFGGAAWIRPDYRRHGIGGRLPRLTRAFAYASWGPEWLTCMIKREHVEFGIAQAYGYSGVDFAIRFPGSGLGDADLALARQHSSELLQMVEDFVAAPLTLPKAA